MIDVKKLTPEDKELLLEEIQRYPPNLKLSTLLFGCRLRRQQY
jgi:hypothetical protein